VHKGQKEQFDQIKVCLITDSVEMTLANSNDKARYWSQDIADPVILTQISLLLSLWSPPNPGHQNNSYWLDMAFRHANEATLWESRSDYTHKSCSLRVLWWCCVVRDRVLAIGLRRPHRLHKVPSEVAVISEQDFGSEEVAPFYTDIGSKRMEILAFIWLCRLSEIMAAIAAFQNRINFDRDWNGAGSGDNSAELEDVILLDRRLDSWRASFEIAVHEATVEDDNHRPVPVSVSILYILHWLVSIILQC
jgi:hypothetical protein